jgi:hypothetical protein
LPEKKKQYRKDAAGEETKAAFFMGMLRGFLGKEKRIDGNNSICYTTE